jgi:hypothetical protein
LRHRDAFAVSDVQHHSPTIPSIGIVEPKRLAVAEWMSNDQSRLAMLAKVECYDHLAERTAVRARESSLPERDHKKPPRISCRASRRTAWAVRGREKAERLLSKLQKDALGSL